MKGLVIRTSSVIPEMKQAHFFCTTSRCSNVIMVNMERGKINQPSWCSECEGWNTFEIDHNLSIFTDKQYIKFQERPSDIPEGETPINIQLVVYDDLVDETKPGDYVDIIGIYRASSWKVSKNTWNNNLNSIFSTYIDVISIVFPNEKKIVLNNEFHNEVDNLTFTNLEIKQFKAFSKNKNLYERLIKSFAPNLYEMDSVKLGILCLLFSGSKKIFDEKS